MGTEDEAKGEGPAHSLFPLGLVLRRSMNPDFKKTQVIEHRNPDVPPALSQELDLAIAELYSRNCAQVLERVRSCHTQAEFALVNYLFSPREGALEMNIGTNLPVQVTVTFNAAFAAPISEA